MKIFWDCDETLVHSSYCKNKEEVEDYIAETPEYEGKHVVISSGLSAWGEPSRCENYVCFLRPWALEAINYTRELVGAENVYILSMGIRQYVFQLNDLWGFGFPKEKIFGREDISYPKNNFDADKTILIDNENYEYHSSGINNKVNFLGGLPPSMLIQVPHFFAIKNKAVQENNLLDNLKQNLHDSLR